MSTHVYADKLIQQGQSVKKLAGVYWMLYHGALITASAMPVYTDLAYRDALRLVKETGALFIRYVSDAHLQVTNWWSMVCREYQFSRASANTRSKIHRGLKRLLIKRVHPNWLAQHGYDCHVNSYRRYRHASPETHDHFISEMRALAATGVFEGWAGFYKSALVGYILCLKEDDGIFMHTIDITPAGLHNYAAYAMIHELLEYYVNQLGIPVSNGSRAILHATNIQDFLQKFGFVREYGVLHIVYRPIVGLLVKFLFPFRMLFLHLHTIPIFHKISAILQQEHLHRQCIAGIGLTVRQRTMKRSFDILIASVGLILFGGVILLCWLLASIDTRQNGIFSQSRVGRYGRPFNIYKIRTMRSNVDIDTSVTCENDPRITKFGAILRRFKLDELPQLFNVLLGHMSFVGPRPDVESFADALLGDDRVILSVRPGITGPATLAFRDEEKILAAVQDPENYNREVIYPEKVRINTRYIEEYRFRIDIYYILVTLFPFMTNYLKWM